jgi:hypothetical protein
MAGLARQVSNAMVVTVLITALSLWKRAYQTGGLPAGQNLVMTWGQSGSGKSQNHEEHDKSG